MKEIKNVEKGLFNLFKIIVLLVMIVIDGDLNAQQIAFPGAEGYGRFAKGGRGGDVYIVTNLNDDGVGSFRYGVENQSGPRTIVFAISGTIELKSNIRFKKSYLTIAGQTAPGDGVCFKDHGFRFDDADDVIMRYIRIRYGDLNKSGLTGDDCITTDDVNDMIFDHISVGWGIDAIHDLRRDGHFTLQWSIYGETLHNSIHYEGGSHSKLGSMRAVNKNITLHHNLLHSTYDRHPTLGGSASLADVIFDFRNNLIYNMGGKTNFGSSICNAINNYYKDGPSTNYSNYPMKIKADLGAGLPTGFVSGNVFTWNQDWTNDNFSAIDYVLENGGSYQTSSREAWELPNEQVFGDDKPVTQTAEDAYDLVLQYAGASKSRDSCDERIINEVKDGAGFVPDSQDEVGGWPTLTSTTAPVDTDKDGMPDDWETTYGLNPNDAEDRNGDWNNDGYTNLEKYINSLTGVHILIKPTLKIRGIDTEIGYLNTDTIPLNVQAFDYGKGTINSMEVFLDNDSTPIISSDSNVIDTSIIISTLGKHQIVAKIVDDSNQVVFDSVQFIVGTSYDTLTIDTTGAGTVTLSPSGGVYVNGTQVTLEAIPDFSDMFSNWSGAVNEDTSSLLITIDSNISITANFVKDTASVININFQPEGSAIIIGYLPDYGYEYGDRGNGYNYGWVGSDNFETRTRSGEPDLKKATLNHMQKRGSVDWEIELDNGNYAAYMHMGDAENKDNLNNVKIESIDITDEDGEDYFDAYDIDKILVADGKLTIEPTGDNAKINYIRLKLIGEAFDSYQLSIGNGSGSGNFIAGYVADIEAKDSTGFTFARWSGDTAYIEDVYDKSTKLTMPDTNVSVVAEYDFLPKYMLTVTDGSGEGKYVAGEYVSIKANTPDSGQVFDKWIGDVTGVSDINDYNTVIDMPASDVSLTATYKPEEITIDDPTDTTDTTDTNVTNIANNAINQLQVYPNPAGSGFTIETGSAHQAVIEIYNMYGKLVYYTVANESVIFINNHNLKTGIYYIKVTDRLKNVFTKKLIIK